MSARGGAEEGEARARAEALAAPLVAWFREHARELPWRGLDDPYRVWVSEVMLQQTQVETVKRFYSRFLERFPDVETLAAASQDEVLAAWQGLGFYRRARNLHRGAQLVVSEHDGGIPRDAKTLMTLPGLGRYSVGAILSLTFGQRLPILDGNVGRVLSRVFQLEGSLKSSAVQRRLWELAEACLPEDDPGAFNEGLMELGALVCRPTSPACERCPLASLCGAHAAGRATDYPETSPAPKVPTIERVVVLLTTPQGDFRLEQRPTGGLLARMWELPAETLEAGRDPLELASELARARGVSARPRLRGTAEHRFSHRHWLQHVYRVETRAKRATSQGVWVNLENLSEHAVPTAALKTLRVAGVDA